MRDDPDDKDAQGLLVPLNSTTFVLRDGFRHALTMLLWGLAALLLMMCANVGSLLLARASRRERDTAVRIALGASRRRLLTAALLESAALGLVGAAGGIALAFAGAPLFARLLPLGSNANPVSLAPSLTIALLALGLSLLLSLLFGTVPAWLTLRAMPQHARRRGTSTRRSSRLSRALLVLQTALTLVLLVETGLMLRTFSALRHTDPGFDVDHLVSFSLVPETAGPNAHRLHVSSRSSRGPAPARPAVARCAQRKLRRRGCHEAHWLQNHRRTTRPRLFFPAHFSTPASIKYPAASLKP